MVIRSLILATLFATASAAQAGPTVSAPAAANPRHLDPQLGYDQRERHPGRHGRIRRERQLGSNLASLDPVLERRRQNRVGRRNVRTAKRADDDGLQHLQGRRSDCCQLSSAVAAQPRSAAVHPRGARLQAAAEATATTVTRALPPSGPSAAASGSGNDTIDHRRPTAAAIEYRRQRRRRPFGRHSWSMKAGGAAEVPEPGSIALLLAGLAGAALFSRRKSV